MDKAVTGIYLLVHLCSGVLPLHAQELTVDLKDEGILIKENDQKVLFYQKETKSLSGEYPRANYVHPLFSLDGDTLTEDFPEDHPHQRGIFWAWHQVYVNGQRVSDGWDCRDITWDVAQIETKTGKGFAGLHATVHWISPNWKNGEQPFIRENTWIKAQTSKKNYRIIDFNIQMLALADSVKLGGSEDVKGYGGFSLRLKLPADIKFTSVDGKVEPRNEAVEAGPWMVFSGSFSGGAKNSGVAVFCHPENPGAINQWILRSSDSMQNPVFPGKEAVFISKDKGLNLKYRLIIYTDVIPEISELYDIYTGE